MISYYASNTSRFFIGASAFSILAINATLTGSPLFVPIAFVVGSVFLFLYANGLKTRPIAVVRDDAVVITASVFAKKTYLYQHGYATRESNGYLKVVRGEKLVEKHRLTNLLKITTQTQGMHK